MTSRPRARTAAKSLVRNASTVRTYSLPATRPAVPRFHGTRLEGGPSAPCERRLAGGTAFDEGVGIKNSVRSRRASSDIPSRRSGCAGDGSWRTRERPSIRALPDGAIRTSGDERARREERHFGHAPRRLGRRDRGRVNSDISPWRPERGCVWALVGRRWSGRVERFRLSYPDAARARLPASGRHIDEAHPCSGTGVLGHLAATLTGRVAAALSSGVTGTVVGSVGREL